MTIECSNENRTNSLCEYPPCHIKKKEEWKPNKRVKACICGAIGSAIVGINSLGCTVASAIWLQETIPNSTTLAIAGLTTAGISAVSFLTLKYTAKTLARD